MPRAICDTHRDRRRRAVFRGFVPTRSRTRRQFYRGTDLGRNSEMLLTTACALLVACGPWPAAIANGWAGESAVPVVVVADGASSQDPAPAPAQEPAAQKAEQKEPPTPPHTGVHALASGLVGDVKHLPSKPNAFLALLGGGIAAGIHPIDDDVNDRLKGSENVWRPGKYVGLTPVQMGAAVGVYTDGRVEHEDQGAHLG